jgi:hypothetical protein
MLGTVHRSFDLPKLYDRHSLFFRADAYMLGTVFFFSVSLMVLPLIDLENNALHTNGASSGLEYLYRSGWTGCI